MTKKQKKKLYTALIFVGIAFLAMVLFVPMMKVEPVALGAEATAYQNFHKFFTDVKDWFSDNIGLVALIGGLGIGGYLILKKK